MNKSKVAGAGLGMGMAAPVAAMAGAWATEFLARYSLSEATLTQTELGVTALVGALLGTLLGGARESESTNKLVKAVGAVGIVALLVGCGTTPGGGRAVSKSACIEAAEQGEMVCSMGCVTAFTTGSEELDRCEAGCITASAGARLGCTWAKAE
jgi:hypothetical protein